jgi:hypothetical protein
VIIRIVGELKYVGRKGHLVLRYVAVFCSILVKNGVGVAGHVFVRVDSDECGVAYAGINGI